MDQSHLQGLNADQLSAALAMSHCMVVAAPGSGKTKMLASKAAYLLSGGRTVVAVTFTKDSALELRDRIIKQAGDKYIENLLVGTFHSIDMLMAFPGQVRTPMGRNILRHSKSNLKAPWKIVREGARRDAVQRAIDASGVEVKDIAEATSIIEALKSGHRKPDTEEEQELLETYTDILEKYGVIDFQDILLKTNQGLMDGTISPLKTDFMLLDEYQDTDRPQLEWAFVHAKAGTFITAVGDDDQSIYGFRNALGYAGMQEFSTALNAQKIILGMNYRSHSEILTPSAALIEYNGDNRVPKALVPFKGAGGEAAWETFSRQIEPYACLSEITKSLQRNETVGVLARTNKRLDDIEAQLIREKIPYTRSAGDSILNSRETALMLATMSIVVKEDPKDVDQLLAWCTVDEDDLAVLHKQLGQKIFERLMAGGQTLMGSLPLKDGTKKILRALIKRINDWRSYVLHDCADFVVTRACELLIEHTQNNRSKAVLPIVAEIFKKTASKVVATSFPARLEEIKKMVASPGERDSDSSVAVSLMTAHGSKGLEFDMVWILGADDGVFPSKDSSLQEERRLFYVAMTRARKMLWISTTTIEISEFILNSGLSRVPSNYFADFHLS